MDRLSVLKQIAARVKTEETVFSKESVWEKCVYDAKLHLSKMHEHRMSIASLAMEACGIVDKLEKYSPQMKKSPHKLLKRFANEIGIPYQTLWDWVGVKISIADKVSNYSEVKYSKALRLKRKIGYHVPKEEVQEMYDATLDEDPLVSKYEDHVRRLSAIKSFVRDNELYPNMKNHIRNLCSEILELTSVG